MKKKYIIIIIILIIALLGLGGYIIYDKFIKEDKKDPQQEQNNNPVEEKKEVNEIACEMNEDIEEYDGLEKHPNLIEPITTTLTLKKFMYLANKSVVLKRDKKGSLLVCNGNTCKSFKTLDEKATTMKAYDNIFEDGMVITDKGIYIE